MSHTVTVCSALLAACILSILPARGQTIPQDSSIQLSKDRAISVYQDYLGAQSPIYSGLEHLHNSTSIRGNPCFETIEATPGSVVYDGDQYMNIYMIYDLISDQIACAGRNGILVDLFMNKVSAFTLHGHHFIHSSRGTYDQLLTGYFSIEVRRTRYLLDSIAGYDILHVVRAKDYFYAVKNDVYYELTDERRLLDLMNDRRQEVKDFIHKRKIRYRKDPENAIIAITAYYNQLSR
jgi:hypothetical protein